MRQQVEPKQKQEKDSRITFSLLLLKKKEKKKESLLV
jgi:hypothetical protein